MASGLGLASESQATVQFAFNYTDAAGFGFNAAGQTGINRRAGLQTAANYISGILGPSYTATIKVDVDGSITENNFLAAAGSNWNAPISNVGFNEKGDVMLKILGGNAADPDINVADAEVSWNFQDFSWEPLNDFQPGEMDLISTAVHELTHTLGFASDIQKNGRNAWNVAPGNQAEWTPFDRWVANGAGTAIIDSTGTLNATRWNAASVGGTGAAGLRWIGPNAVAANGGNPVYLYSPTTWEEGSSGSHLDTDFYTGAAFKLMNHAASVPDGLDIRTFSALEIGMLKDIGYTAVIPEPASLSLAILGLAGMLRRHRR